jgi:hypothetical protein
MYRAVGCCLFGDHSSTRLKIRGHLSRDHLAAKIANRLISVPPLGPMA